METDKRYYSLKGRESKNSENVNPCFLPKNKSSGSVEGYYHIWDYSARKSGCLNCLLEISPGSGYIYLPQGNCENEKYLLQSNGEEVKLRDAKNCKCSLNLVESSITFATH